MTRTRTPVMGLLGNRGLWSRAKNRWFVIFLVYWGLGFGLGFGVHVWVIGFGELTFFYPILFVCIYF